ncbi:MAG: hypothetical protein M5R40_03265 [Anaerolineae bacterium]|nr:hypothetical protein [Anaerolineae bacterium]
MRSTASTESANHAAEMKNTGRSPRAAPSQPPTAGETISPAE